MTQHTPHATWMVDVFPEIDLEDEEVTPEAVALVAYETIMNADMYPILEVTMPDGSVHTVDLDEVMQR